VNVDTNGKMKVNRLQVENHIRQAYMYDQSSTWVNMLPFLSLDPDLSEDLASSEFDDSALSSLVSPPVTICQKIKGYEVRSQTIYHKALDKMKVYVL
jgi:hypothetical protein